LPDFLLLVFGFLLLGSACGAFGSALMALAFPCFVGGLFACGAFGSALMALAFPCFVIGLLGSPLCGAAPTFLCRRKEK
jgi:hypothetical protein